MKLSHTRAIRTQISSMIALIQLARCSCVLANAFHTQHHQLAPLEPPANPAKLHNISHANYFAKYYTDASSCNKDRAEIERHRRHSPEELADLVLSRRARDDELPVMTSSVNADDERQLWASEMTFYRQDELHQKYSVAEVVFMGLIALSQSSVYNDVFLHYYDNYGEMKSALGPKVDSEVCLGRLENMVARVQRLAAQRYSSRDFNIFQIQDTWGHAPAGLSLGHLFAEGSHDECERLKLVLGAGQKEDEKADMRYCVLTFKHIDWPRIDKHDIMNLKAGICIPKACDSSNYKNKFQLVGQFARFQLRPAEVGQLKISNMYCLPDEDSPMRSVWHSRKATITLACLSLWVMLLLFATYKHRNLEKLSSDEGANSKAFDLTIMNLASQACYTKTRTEQESGLARLDRNRTCTRLKIYRLLSITRNLNLLFDTEKESSLICQQASGSKTRELDGDQTSENIDQNNNEAENKQEDERKQQELGSSDTPKFIDLGCIEGIKVVAMCYVIMGHVLMCLPTLMMNGRELANRGTLAFFLANLVPAFAVNSFFTITGLLTCYLVFKQNKSQRVISSPGKWLAFILYRYLRIAPIYALVVLYCKTLAKYTGRGPFWDYGTSSLAQRKMCEQEPWSYTLTFTSNFLPPMEHCIPGGWYLSNDFQFFLLTPLFLAALARRPKLGKALLCVCIVAGHLAGFYSIFASSMSDLRPIARFSPHGFKTYVSHLSFNYTQPQYRIPAYLIGLLVGFKLFELEEKRRQFAKLDEETKKAAGPMPDWSRAFRHNANPLCLLLVTFCCLTSVIGPMLPFSKPAARLMVALVTPTCHVAFSAAVGMYIMMATTGHGNKCLNQILSARLWKPLARLSLCAVLVNVEVINYIVQTSSHQHFVTNQFHFSLNCFCILCTYLVATLVCVFFEAPMRAILNALLTQGVQKLSRKQKAS